MESEWDVHQATIRKLYLTDNKPLSVVMAHMKKYHSLNASKGQFERHLKRWNFRKNCTEGEWKFVYDRIEKRKTKGKESEVFFNGVLIPSKKIKKEMSRHFTPTFVQRGAFAARPQTPEGIFIRTPNSMNPAPVVLENLPWFMFQNHVQSQDTYLQSFFIHDKYSQDLLSVQTRAYSPSLPVDFESLLSGSPEQLGKTPVIADISEHTLCFLLKGLAVTESKNEVLQIGTDILPYLQATLLERHNGELMTSIQKIIEPGNANGLPLFLNVAAYLISNNLMEEIQIDYFLNWFIENGHRVLLGSFFSVKIPTIEALAQAIFRSALRIGDTYLVQLMMGADFKLDLCSPLCINGPTPLEAVVGTGNIELAQIILANDVHDHMASCKSRVPALYQAVRKDNVTLTQLLLNAVVNAYPGSQYLDTLLQKAARCGCSAVSQMLLDMGANVNKRSSIDIPPLFQAVRSGNLNLVEILLNVGADVNAPETQEAGGTALQEAARANNIAMTQLLLNYGADVNAPASRYSCSALQEAVRGGNTALVKLLLAAGADIDKLGFKRKGETAFNPAELHKNVELIQLLRNSGADETVLAVSNLNQALFLEAAKQNDTKMIKKLLDIGVDVNKSTGTRMPLLHLAVRKGNIEAVRVLLAAGADINTTYNAQGHCYHEYATTALREAVVRAINVLFGELEQNDSHSHDSAEGNHENDGPREDDLDED